MTYAEDALIEQPAIRLFEALDWEIFNCWDKTFGDPHSMVRKSTLEGRAVWGQRCLAAKRTG